MHRFNMHLNAHSNGFYSEWTFIEFYRIFKCDVVNAIHAFLPIERWFSKRKKNKSHTWKQKYLICRTNAQTPTKNTYGENTLFPTERKKSSRRKFQFKIVIKINIEGKFFTFSKWLVCLLCVCFLLSAV